MAAGVEPQPYGWERRKTVPKDEGVVHGTRLTGLPGMTDGGWDRSSPPLRGGSVAPFVGAYRGECHYWAGLEHARTQPIKKDRRVRPHSLRSSASDSEPGLHIPFQLR